MRIRFLTGLMLVVCSAVLASAEELRAPKRGKAAASLPLRPKALANPCGEYGPGFVRIEGSSTCIKIGGSFSVGVGASR
jgi:hypothetical protein